MPWRAVPWRAVACRAMPWRGVAWRAVAWRGVPWRGVAWRAVAWRGVAWRGVAWRGVAWRGVPCRAVPCHAVAWRGVAWRGVAWRGVAGRGVAVVRCGVGRCGAVWGGVGRCGAVWGGVGRGVAWRWCGAVWGGVGRCGAVWGGVGRCGAGRGVAVVRCGVGRCGAVWGGVGRCGAVWGGVGRCGAVWGGVGRCGAVWGGVGRCGAVWGGVGRGVAWRWCGAVWGGVGRCGAVWGGVGRCGAGRGVAVVRCGVGRCGAVWGGVGRCGAVWGGVGRCGAVWGGVGRCGAVWGGVGRCGAVRCGAGRCGAVWGGAVWGRAVWGGVGRCGAVRCGVGWGDGCRGCRWWLCQGSTPSPSCPPSCSATPAAEPRPTCARQVTSTLYGTPELGQFYSTIDHISMIETTMAASSPAHAAAGALSPLLLSPDQSPPMSSQASPRAHPPPEPGLAPHLDDALRQIVGGDGKHVSVAEFSAVDPNSAAIRLDLNNLLSFAVLDDLCNSDVAVVESLETIPGAAGTLTARLVLSANPHRPPPRLPGSPRPGRRGPSPPPRARGSPGPASPRLAPPAMAMAALTDSEFFGSPNVPRKAKGKGKASPPRAKRSVVVDKRDVVIEFDAPTLPDADEAAPAEPSARASASAAPDDPVDRGDVVLEFDEAGKLPLPRAPGDPVNRKPSRSAGLLFMSAVDPEFPFEVLSDANAPPNSPYPGAPRGAKPPARPAASESAMRARDAAETAEGARADDAAACTVLEVGDLPDELAIAEPAPQADAGAAAPETVPVLEVSAHDDAEAPPPSERAPKAAGGRDFLFVEAMASPRSGPGDAPPNTPHPTTPHPGLPPAPLAPPPDAPDEGAGPDAADAGGGDEAAAGPAPDAPAAGPPRSRPPLPVPPGVRDMLAASEWGPPPNSPFSGGGAGLRSRTAPEASPRHAPPAGPDLDQLSQSEAALDSPRGSELSPLPAPRRSFTPGLRSSKSPRLQFGKSPGLQYRRSHSLQMVEIEIPGATEAGPELPAPEAESGPPTPYYPAGLGDEGGPVRRRSLSSSLSFRGLARSASRPIQFLSDRSQSSRDSAAREWDPPAGAAPGPGAARGPASGRWTGAGPSSPS